MLQHSREAALKDKIGMILRCAAKLAILLLANSAFALQNAAAPTPNAQPAPVLCTGAYSPDCLASADDQKIARKEFESGLKLKREGQANQAFQRFSDAAGLVPRNIDYLTAREIMRQQLVLERIRNGDSELASRNDVAAMAAFRSALELDPANGAAAERLREAARLTSTPESQPQPQPMLRSAGRPQLIEVVPQQGSRNFHLRTDTRSLFVQIAQAYGITAHVDDQITPRPIRFDVNNANFAEAIQTAELMAHAFWVPVSDREILVEPDTAQARQQFERVALETFYISSVSTPQDLNEFLNMLRAVFDTQKMSINTHASTVTLRAPVRLLQEAEQLIANLQEGPPQVMIDVTVYQVSHTMLRDLGVALPLQFQMFNLSNVAAALAGSNLQNILAGLGGSGAVNGQSVSAILAQLQGQNSQLSALLANPIATFGGGRTFFGVGIPPATLQLSLNSSNIHQLDHLTLHVEHGNDATFHFGVRYPVLTASYSAVYNIPGLSQLTGGGQNLAAFPSVNYQDLGLTVKATPHVHGDSDVTLKLDTQIQALGASSVNGVPVLDNRQYQGTINVKDGETAVIAGSVSEQDTRNIQGIPALTRLPVLGHGVSEHNTQVNDDELLITITTHITHRRNQRSELIVMTP
jgi:general secretion pathway protein D